MIIYENLKEGFINDVESDILVKKILENFKTKIGNTGKSEINSWRNSLSRMYIVLNDQEIPSNTGVAIEYKIPTSSKRIDFIISGKNEHNNSAVIVELKQWDEVEKVEDKDGIVRTALGGGIRETTHPSYQVSSYANLITDFNESVSKGNVDLSPCAYLHNYNIEEPYDPLADEVYKPYYDEAPIFAGGDVKKLRDFIKKHIKYGDNKETLYLIENGKIKPSKSLQDSLTKMLEGNKEFTMIDDQKVIYEDAVHLARKAYHAKTKEVMIIRGGPGTGKSVLAVQLLVNLINEDMLCQYITKNTAPRQVYAAKLKGDMTRTSIDNLFKSSGIYHNLTRNEIDVALVDEAHRLSEKSGIFYNLGDNQTMEIINTARCSIFFIDESQRVHFKDAGTIETIKKFANKAKANITEYELESQFRCNGSNGYISFLDDVLQIKSTANSDGFDLDYDIQILDDPNTVFDMIVEKNTNNKSRMLAGYCWNWDKESKNDPDSYDIVIDKYNFKKSWNLGNSSTYMIDPNSINQIGCIHTSQGLELDYVGIIIGNDLRYENNQIITDYTKRAKSDRSLRGLKKLLEKDKEKGLKIADEIIKNTYRVLLTRGQKGCYIYCEDSNLKQYLKDRINSIKKIEDNFN